MVHSGLVVPSLLCPAFCSSVAAYFQGPHSRTARVSAYRFHPCASLFFLPPTLSSHLLTVVLTPSIESQSSCSKEPPMLLWRDRDGKIRSEIKEAEADAGRSRELAQCKHLPHVRSVTCHTDCRLSALSPLAYTQYSNPPHPPSPLSELNLEIPAGYGVKSL